jgi:hypothetical protein
VLVASSPYLEGTQRAPCEEFVSQHVNDLEFPTFFLCGPKGFMESACRILSTLGVHADRILQESFGENRSSTKSSSGDARMVERGVFSQPEKVLSGFRREYLAGSGRGERGTDTLWMPRRPVRHMLYASPGRYRSSGRRKWADERTEKCWICAALCQRCYRKRCGGGVDLVSAGRDRAGSVLYSEKVRAGSHYPRCVSRWAPGELDLPTRVALLRQEW